MKKKLEILKKEFDNLINYSVDEELMDKLRIIMPYSYYNSRKNLNENKKIIKLYEECKEKLFYYSQLEKKQNAYLIIKCTEELEENFDMQDCLTILINYINLYKRHYLKQYKKDDEEKVKRLIEFLNERIKSELFLTALKVKTNTYDELNDLINPVLYTEECFKNPNELIKNFEDKIKNSEKLELKLEIVYGRKNLKDEEQSYTYINLYNTKINSVGYYYFDF